VSIPLLDPAVVDRVARQRARRRTAARVVVLTLAAVALLPRLVLAQGASPWENAVDVLRAAFTGPIARGLSLVAIVVGGLAFAYGEGQSKRMIAGIVFGVGMAIGAVNFMAWLFPSRPAMASELSVHAVYKSINRPLTIWGADRRLFLLALMLGAAVFNFFGSLAGGLIVFLALYAAARWLTATDPHLLRVLFNAGAVRTEYDPSTLAPVTIRRRRRART